MWLPWVLLLLWVPASTSMPPTSITAAKTSTITTVFPSVSSTSMFAVSATHSTSNRKENEEVVSSQLPLLLSLLALLLLLLMGASLLAWRMFQKRIKAGEHSELSQKPKQAAPREELHYASVVFDSNTNRLAAQRPQEKEPDSYYSVIKKT
uniref:CD300a molecule n=1 Tax=Colobus angolensis palliatus TaxID=336983 RepID=A0A2K5JLU2_COLAP